MNKIEACKILDIPVTYTQEQLKRQYHINALRWHPDKNLKNKDEATIKFQKITEAYNYLLKSDSTYHDDSKIKNTYEYILKAFVDFLIHNKFSVKILLELDSEQLQLIIRYLRLCSQNNSIHTSYLEHIERLISEIEKISEKRETSKNIILLEPSIDDLFEQKLFKLNYGNEVFFVPLWHNDMTFTDISKNEFNVRCEPKLEKHIDIDENNNILVFINYDIKRLLDTENIKIDIGKKTFLIPKEELKLQRRQKYVLKKCGIPKIKDTECSYDILFSDIIIHFTFY